MLKEIEVVTPDSESQVLLMDTIYGNRGIKAGYTEGYSKEKVLKIAKLLVRQNIEIIIAGCTEISLVLDQEDLTIPLFDPLYILTKVIVKRAKGY